jgi:hypothetical protein
MPSSANTAGGRARARLVILALSVTLVAACAPARVSQTHTTATSSREPPALSEIAQEPVATLGLFAPGGLQGFSPFLSYGLAAALADVAPSLRVTPVQDAMNRLNEQGMAGEYAELIAGFARSSILDRDRLGRIGSALGARYVFLPGVAELTHNLFDRFEMGGLKVLRNNVTTLRLWLQLWDVKSGQLLWESVGEATVANPILTSVQATPLGAIAQRLWRRMLQDDLVSRTSGRAPPSVSPTNERAGPRPE